MGNIRYGVVAALLVAVWLTTGTMAPLDGSYAETRSVAPGINSYYRDPDFERWRGTFERPGREVYDRRHEIIDALSLRRGMDVADIGAGTGLFTRLVAAEVGPDGNVYAVDVARSFVRGAVGTAREQGLMNVEGVVNTQRSVELPPNSIDLALLVDTYHHFEHPHAMLDSIRDALRPRGDLVIIDFRKQEGVASDWVMGHVRASRRMVIEEVTGAGFTHIGEQEDPLRTNYLLRFRRPAE